MANYFCSECNREIDVKICPLCESPSEALDVNERSLLDEQLKDDLPAEDELFYD